MERAAVVLSDCRGVGVERKGKARKPEAELKEPEELQTTSMG